MDIAPSARLLLFCRHVAQFCGHWWSIAIGLPVPLCALFLRGTHTVPASLFASIYFQGAANGCCHWTLAPSFLVSLFCNCRILWLPYQLFVMIASYSIHSSRIFKYVQNIGLWLLVFGRFWLWMWFHRWSILMVFLTLSK